MDNIKYKELTAAEEAAAAEDTNPAEEETQAAEDTTQPAEEETQSAERASVYPRSVREMVRQIMQAVKRKEVDTTKENDIAYRAPFSYRHLKAFAWLFIVFAQYVFIQEKKSEIITDHAVNQYLLAALSSLSELALPLILIATFAVLVNGSDSYKKMLVKNGAITLGFFFGFLFVYERYLIKLSSVFSESRSEARSVIDEVLASLSGDRGIFTFNIFVDIFLFTLVMFFANYDPKRYFQGEKIRWFRMMVLIPIIYEIACEAFIIISIATDIRLSAFFSPFLPTKSPIVFIMFLDISYFFKNREHQFIKNGKTTEEHRAFLETNTNAWQFSAFLIKKTVFYTVLDAVLAVLAGSIYAAAAGISYNAASDAVKKFGFGNTATFVMTIPFIFLFSYTKKYRSAIIDLIIPVVGVFLIIFLYIDSALTTIPELLRSSIALA